MVLKPFIDHGILELTIQSGRYMLSASKKQLSTNEQSVDLSVPSFSVFSLFTSLSKDKKDKSDKQDE